MKITQTPNFSAKNLSFYHLPIIYKTGAAPPIKQNHPWGFLKITVGLLF